MITSEGRIVRYNVRERMIHAAAAVSYVYLLRTGLAAPRSTPRVVEVTTTGTFGPGTERALRRWQAEHGLSRTGVVGPATWRALLRLRLPDEPRLESAA